MHATGFTPKSSLQYYICCSVCHQCLSNLTDTQPDLIGSIVLDLISFRFPQQQCYSPLPVIACCLLSVRQASYRRAETALLCAASSQLHRPKWKPLAWESPSLNVTAFWILPGMPASYNSAIIRQLCVPRIGAGRGRGGQLGDCV